MEMKMSAHGDSPILYACHHLNTRNIGDRIDSPTRYFDFGRCVRLVDLQDWRGGDTIFGGGGLLYPDFEGILHAASQRKDCKRIVWGVGTNYHGETHLIHPAWIEDFDAYALRDVGGKHWVPSASCMHREFDQPRPAPTRDVVVYCHPDEISLPYPTMWNNQMPWAFWKVLDFLASAECVITNSYHGAYWAALLGRKVVCWNPPSNRFLFVPWKQVIYRGGDLALAIQYAEPNPPMLAACRHANQLFYKEVMSVLNEGGLWKSIPAVSSLVGSAWATDWMSDMVGLLQ